MRDQSDSMLADAYCDAYRRLRTTASRYVHWQDADDMVQDTFVRALQCQRGFRHEASPVTWLHRILINTCHDERRRERRRDRIAAAAASIATSTAERPHPLEHLGVRAAFEGLSQDDRAICLLYDVLGFTHQEIAAALRIPVGTSKSRLCVARRRLSGKFGVRRGRRVDPAIAI
jgi:RNA polymerase sigma-70 factor (ECF subfamily)